MSRSGRAARRAVVVGASIAGSLIAKVLADRFDEVVLLDRDTFSPTPAPRTAVPQEHHIHLLLRRGKEIMERLYPGFLADIEMAGAEVVDLSHGVKWFIGGRWKNRWPTGVTAHYCSRTLIEHVLRRHAARLPGVEIREGTTVQGLVLDRDDKAVRGVRVSDRAGASSELLADLVVDASGRGSDAATWLADMGYGEVGIEKVVVRLGYVSRVYRRDDALMRKWRVLLVTPRLPDDRRMAAVSPIEGDRVMVTAGGWFDAFPDATESSFLSFLAELPVTDVHDVVAGLTPLSELKRYRMPGGLRRRYDLCKAWPPGFLIAGDAICSINPIYSQGMSVSAMQVEAFQAGLDAFLAGQIGGTALLARMVAATERSWQQAKAGDERLPEMAVRPGVIGRLRRWYFDALVAASTQNRAITIALLKVNNLVTADRALFSPSILLSVLGSSARRSLGLGLR